MTDLERAEHKAWVDYAGAGHERLANARSCDDFIAGYRAGHAANAQRVSDLLRRISTLNHVPIESQADADAFIRAAVGFAVECERLTKEREAGNV